jgi:hypothetical protein
MGYKGRRKDGESQQDALESEICKTEQLNVGDEVFAVGRVGRFAIVSIGTDIAKLKLLDGARQPLRTIDAPLSTLSRVTYDAAIKDLVGTGCLINEMKWRIVSVLKYSDLGGDIHKQIDHCLFRVQSDEFHPEQTFDIPGWCIAALDKLLPDED